MSATQDFIVKDGVLKKYVGTAAEVVIPDGVTTIEERAFYTCKSVEHVTIPSSVTAIGAQAFACCRHMLKVTIPSSVQRIGEHAFSMCDSLGDIELLFVSDEEGFRKTRYLKAVWDAFERTAQASTVAYELLRCAPRFVKVVPAIKNTVKREQLAMMRYAARTDDAIFVRSLFSLYPKLTLDELDGYIALCHHAPSVMAYLLDYKALHYSVQEQDELAQDKLDKALGLKARTVAEWKQMFTLATDGEDIRINGYRGTDTHADVPPTIGKRHVRAIGRAAFSPWADRITDTVVARRGALSSVTVSDGVTAIGARAFAGCRALRSVILPQSIVSIAADAFDACDRLTLYAPRTSYAYRYAKEHALSVRATEDA